MERIPMTADGFTILEDELKELKNVERPNIIVAIAEAREHGDLSENAEYHAARERQSYIEGRITDLEARIGRADVIDSSNFTDDQVRFGAKVTLIDEDSEKEKKYHIVGVHEADLRNGKISIDSPVAKAIMGKEKGSTIEVDTPGGVKYYEIDSIEY